MVYSDRPKIQTQGEVNILAPKRLGGRGGGGEEGGFVNLIKFSEFVRSAHFKQNNFQNYNLAERAILRYVTWRGSWV